MVVVSMIVRMAVAALVMIVIMVDAIMMEVIMIVVMTMIMSMIVMSVRVMRRRDSGTDGSGAMERLQRREKSPPFYPQQSEADEDDERIAQNFDEIDRAFHGRRSCVQERGGNAHEHHRDQRLQQRGGEREHHAAHPGLFIRDHIGRDHRLAVTGPGGVKNAVQERQSKQAPSRAAIGLGGADQARELPIEFSLLGEDPAERAAHRRSRRLRARRAERAGLCERRVERTGQEHKAGEDGDHQGDMNDQSPPDDGFHGHFTKILFAYSAPMVSEGSR